jgi:hypothetical protein
MARVNVDHPRLRDVVVAGVAGGIVAGVPSTVHALATRTSPIEATVAAGTLVLPGERRPGMLMAAALPVHAALSVGWAGVLAAILPAMVPTMPRRRAAATGAAAGAAAGLVIAAVDLGLVGRWFPRIRALPMAPQVADHVAYGLTVGWVLARRRDRRSGERRDGGLWRGSASFVWGGFRRQLAGKGPMALTERVYLGHSFQSRCAVRA